MSALALLSVRLLFCFVLLSLPVLAQEEEGTPRKREPVRKIWLAAEEIPEDLENPV